MDFQVETDCDHLYDEYCPGCMRTCMVYCVVRESDVLACAEDVVGAIYVGSRGCGACLRGAQCT